MKTLLKILFWLLAIGMLTCYVVYLFPWAFQLVEEWKGDIEWFVLYAITGVLSLCMVVFFFFAMLDDDFSNPSLANLKDNVEWLVVMAIFVLMFIFFHSFGMIHFIRVYRATPLEYAGISFALICCLLLATFAMAKIWGRLCKKAAPKNTKSYWKKFARKRIPKKEENGIILSKKLPISGEKRIEKKEKRNILFLSINLHDFTEICEPLKKKFAVSTSSDLTQVTKCSLSDIDIIVIRYASSLSVTTIDYCWKQQKKKIVLLVSNRKKSLIAARRFASRYSDSSFCQIFNTKLDGNLTSYLMKV
ncbi:MAG: hypothetical protein WCG98_03560 [bacterium]